MLGESVGEGEDDALGVADPDAVCVRDRLCVTEADELRLGVPEPLGERLCERLSEFDGVPDALGEPELLAVAAPLGDPVPVDEAVDVCEPVPVTELDPACVSV